MPLGCGSSRGRILPRPRFATAISSPQTLCAATVIPLSPFCAAPRARQVTRGPGRLWRSVLASMAAVEAAFVGVVLVMMLTLLFVGWKTPEIVVFLSLVLVWNAGTISTDDALSGFNNPGVLAVGSLFVVIKGVEKSRLADKAAKHVFGLRTSFNAGLLRLMGLAFLLSAFLNNTPVVALLIPITKDWARTRGFSPSLLLMPLSFACIFGGLVTIIGTSTNLVVQGLVLEAGEEDPSIQGLGFFEPGYIGLPLGLVGMLYLVVAAPRVLPRDSNTGVSQLDRDRTEELVTEVRLMHNFSYIGRPVTLILAHFGLPAETLLKIRRRLPLSTVGTREPRRRQGLHNSHGDVGVSSTIEATPGLFGASLSPPSRNRTPISGRTGCRKRLGGAWDSKSERSPSPAAADAGAALKTREQSGAGPADSRVSDYEHGNRPLSGEGCCNHSTPGLYRDRSSRPFDLGPGPVRDEVRFDDSNRVGTSYTDIHPVEPSEVVRDGDVLFLSCSRSAMISFQGSTVGERLEGVRLLDANARYLEAQGPALLELVLSDRNHFVGSYPAGGNSELLASRYGCRIVAVRHAAASIGTDPEIHPVVAKSALAKADRHSAVVGQGEEGLDDPLRGELGPLGSAPVLQDPMETAAPWDTCGLEVARRPLAPGDVVLVLAGEGFAEKWKDSQDFDLVTRVGSVPTAVRMYDYLSLLVFCGMLGAVLFSSISMTRAAFVAGGVLIVGGWVDPGKSVGYVDWALLLLVGSALGLSKAISNSGLAGYAGNAIRQSGMSASASLYVLYGFTMVCTELITNNAAAALAVPIALSIAEQLEANYKPFVLTVMMAASSSFITPIGYQTNTMVWAPGGYKFSDFIKLGTPLSLIYLTVGSSLMPLLFPF